MVNKDEYISARRAYIACCAYAAEYAQSLLSTKLLMAVKMHQNLQV